MSSSTAAAVDSIFLPPTAVVSPLLALLFIFLYLYFTPGGIAWALSRSPRRSIPGPPGIILALSSATAHRILSSLSRSPRRSIPGPPGIILALSSATAHRILSSLARSLHALPLMSFSVGLTRFIVSSDPATAKEILNSSAFADRPIKESAYGLLFHRAMGFAPFGEYWRSLRRISSIHLFSPRRISDFGSHRRAIGEKMVADIRGKSGELEVRRLLHFGSLNNVMLTVFGRSYEFGEDEGAELEEMVSEGYELLGVFNWGDHFPVLGWLDLQGVRRRCKVLVGRVNLFVGRIVEEHRKAISVDRDSDFVDVLLGLEKEEKLSESDMVAVLWEMIFRGTDTVAILLEWILARMVLHPDIQARAQSELDAVVGSRPVTDSDISNLPYLHAVVKESLRMHPPGPLLSWARLAIHDTQVGPHFVPAGTTAMVNMYAISHHGAIWAEPEEFRPERFLEEEVSVMGSDLRLAPFGSGRRVCPGKAMGLATVHLWLAQLLQGFEWVEGAGGVDLEECLKMSMEMKKPLVCKAVQRF